MAHTVDKKSRRAVDTAADPTHEILTQAGQMRMLGNGAKELSGARPSELPYSARCRSSSAAWCV